MRNRGNRRAQAQRKKEKTQREDALARTASKASAPAPPVKPQSGGITKETLQRLGVPFDSFGSVNKSVCKNNEKCDKEGGAQTERAYSNGWCFHAEADLGGRASEAIIDTGATQALVSDAVYQNYKKKVARLSLNAFIQFLCDLKSP